VFDGGVEGSGRFLVVDVVRVPDRVPHHLFPGPPPRDLGDVGAGEDDGDQLDEGDEDADAGVDVHHGHQVVVHLVLEGRQAARRPDGVAD